MTAPLRNTQQSQLPASQTAPVAEFRCLYTPDIRKKQKKWQDGYLKFHTFNNRVMVYDQARNFLGDTYYKDSNELHEGDELTLDKGVMVEVAEAMGTTQTDLTPLFEKKPKEAPPPPSAPPRRFQPPSQVARPQVAPSSNTARTNAQQLRHKSLNTLLGTPKGPIGKSVPIKSPYEARQEKEREKENDFAVDRAAKRQKTTHSSASSNTVRLSSPVQEDSPAAKKSLPPRGKTSDAKTARRPAKPIPQGAPVITLDELDAVAHIPSDPSMPPTPPRPTEPIARPVVPPASPVRPAAVARPVLQTPRIPRGKVPVPSVKALETPKVAAPSSSPPISASNRLSNVDFAIQPTPAKEPARRPSKQPSPPPPVPASKSPPRQPQPKSLRLSRGVKRGTLMMCQPPLPPPRAREPSEAPTVATKSNSARALHSSRRIPSPTSNGGARSATAAGEPAVQAKRKTATDRGEVRQHAKPRQASPEDISESFDDDQEVIHGFMDQQLLVSPVLRDTPPPEPILVPDSPGSLPPRAKASKAVTRKARKTNTPKATSPEPTRASPPSAPAPVDQQLKKNVISNSKPGRQPSPQAPPAVEVPNIQSRAASPAVSEVSVSRSRTTSLSPRKLAALSTGGFRKKSKRATPQTTPAPEQSPSAPRDETVALPPHPLRANKKGPVMTTTELAAMLQKPKKRTRTTDPIEDEGDTPGISPNRRFRRVRSENDAPIPSTSEDWEKRNLPKSTDTEPVETLEAPDPPAVVARKKSGLAALIKKTDPRKKFVRTQSLTVETSIPPPKEVESPMASPVVDKDIGPWSTEAFDLFDWRPPRREDVEP